MVTTNEKIKYFKSELKNYRYYKEAYNECCLKLEEIAVKLRGVSSTTPKEVIPGASSVRYYNDNKVELMLKEDELVKERDTYLNHIENIEHKLELLEQEEQDVLKSIYVYNHSFIEVADKVYMSTKSLQRYIKRIIKKIM